MSVSYIYIYLCCHVGRWLVFFYFFLINTFFVVYFYFSLRRIISSSQAGVLTSESWFSKNDGTIQWHSLSWQFWQKRLVSLTNESEWIWCGGEGRPRNNNRITRNVLPHLGLFDRLWIRVCVAVGPLDFIINSYVLNIANTANRFIFIRQSLLSCCLKLFLH